MNSATEYITTQRGPDGKDYACADGTFYPIGTDHHLIRTLERARENKTRLRVWFGEYDETGEKLRVFTIENDTMGRIGRTTGPIKAPLLVYNARSRGGTVLDADMIVAIKATKTGRYMWAHKHWAGPGPWTLKPIPSPGDTFAVIGPDNIAHALHLTRDKAMGLIAYMMGWAFRY